MRSFVVGLLVSGLLGCGSGPSSTGLEFDDARMRDLIPGSDKTVGYFVVHNRTGQRVTIVGARSAQARTIELHQTSTVDGVSRMRRLSEVDIEPSASVTFEPGGRHLMVFGVTELTAPVNVVFELASGDQREVEFAVFDFTSI